MLAYWYEGGRPIGCCGLLMAPSELEEADGVTVPLAVRLFEDGCCGCDVEYVLLAPGEPLPLVIVGARVFDDGGDERLVVERVALLALPFGWLLVLRVEPTSLRKRLFI